MVRTERLSVRLELRIPVAVAVVAVASQTSLTPVVPVVRGS
jgi:hypothetical protein